MRLILLNGPPRCGKDTTAEVILNRATRKTIQTKLAVDLKMRCHAAYGLWHPKGGPVHHNAFEQAKDETMECFEGLSPRAAYIAFFENWIVPTHGPQMLGTWLVRRLQRVLEIESAEQTSKALAPTEFVVISDCRRSDEVEPLREKFGSDAITIVRLHREGHTWDGDVKDACYLDLDGIRCVDVKNPESIIDGLFVGLRDALPEVFAPRLVGQDGTKL